jgi:hypothetical protein
VICPSDAVAAVLKGAVMYGHNPELISERICPRTYGIRRSPQYQIRYSEHTLTQNSFFQLLMVRPIVP